MDVQVDRLSSLSDDVIHKILSFISIKDAIGTSVLSSRWRFIWTSMPYLNFENLNYGLHISKFISDVLSHRNTQIHVSSVSLVLGKTVRDDESVTRILNYAFSHNVQQLTLTRSPGNIVGRPLSYRLSSFIATPTWDLPALTTLHLHYIQLSDDIGFFSKCTNLKNLSLRRCTLMNGTKGFNICLPQLSNLTLEYICLCLDTELEEYVNVVAPQLKNLTIIWCPGKHLISAPGLVSLVIKGPHPWEISTPGFPSLEKVDLIMHNVPTADAHKIVCLLQKLRSAKLLIIGVGILQRLFRERKHLSSSMELLPPEACVFANAKISKFITKMPVKVFLEVRAQEKVTTSTSHSVMFPMVSLEEIEAMKDMAEAHVFVKRLGMLLKQCKANNTNGDTSMTEHGKPQVKKHRARKLQLNLEEMMEMIKQSKFVASEICLMAIQCMSTRRGTLEIIAWLEEIRSLFQTIKGWMTQLSAPKRVVMQPNYSTLCEDGAIVTNYILEWMKTRNQTPPLII